MLLVPDVLNPVPPSQFPVINKLAAEVKVKVPLTVRADASIVPTAHQFSDDKTPSDPASVNAAVSWASGKLFTAGVPFDVVAQPVADQFCAPARFQ